MATITRRLIMDSFIRLLEARPVNKISVKDIVEDCGINRNTFYYHFADIPALAEAIVKAEADVILESVDSVSSLEACVETAVHHVKAHRQAIWHIYHSASREIYELYLMKICDHVVTLFIDNALGARRLMPEDRAAIIEGYKCELFGFVTDWLNHDMSDEMERGFLRLLDLRQGSTEQMFERALQYR